MTNPGVFDMTYKVRIHGETGDWWCDVTAPCDTRWDAGAFEFAHEARKGAAMLIEAHMDNFDEGRDE